MVNACVSKGFELCLFEIMKIDNQSDGTIDVFMDYVNE